MTNGTIYTVAVAGMGKRGMHHADAVAKNPRLRLVGLCDLDQARLDAANSPDARPHLLVTLILDSAIKKIEEKQAQAAPEESEESPLGLVVRELDANLAKRFRLKETQGVLVLQVEQGSAAADAGLRPGDLILEINGLSVQSLKDYQKIIKEVKKHSFYLKPGEKKRVKQALARKRLRKKMRNLRG